MTKKFVQKGDHLTLVAPAALASGEPTLIGSIFGVSVNTVAMGDEGVFALEGVHELPKVTLDVVTQGAPLYFVESSGLLSIDDDTGNNKFVGVAIAAAGDTATTVLCRLNGVAVV